MKKIVFAFLSLFSLLAIVLAKGSSVPPASYRIPMPLAILFSVIALSVLGLMIRILSEIQINSQK
jgi:hypothetical protein